jgi:aldehyde dehydrogenase (NAD+)
MNDTFGITKALKELGLNEINEGSSTGNDCFSSGSVIESC